MVCGGEAGGYEGRRLTKSSENERFRVRPIRFTRSWRTRKQARSQKEADRLACLIEAMKASKLAGDDFTLPDDLCENDRRLVIATALGQIEAMQNRTKRPTPKRRADMIEYFIASRGANIAT